jgi:hypothetical protein
MVVEFERQSTDLLTLQCDYVSGALAPPVFELGRPNIPKLNRFLKSSFLTVRKGMARHAPLLYVSRLGLLQAQRQLVVVQFASPPPLKVPLVLHLRADSGRLQELPAAVLVLPKTERLPEKAVLSVQLSSGGFQGHRLVKQNRNGSIHSTQIKRAMQNNYGFTCAVIKPEPEKEYRMEWTWPLGARPRYLNLKTLKLGCKKTLYWFLLIAKTNRRNQYASFTCSSYRRFTDGGR